MKGIPHSVLVIDKTIEIWVESPTGDSSDTQILKITCKDSYQALLIADIWNLAWKLEPTEIDIDELDHQGLNSVEQNEVDWPTVS